MPVKYKNIKTALKKHNLSDPFSLAKYHFSPYMGCQHGCIYCDGRAEKYYFEGDFDKDITIRKNIPEILEKELPKLRERGFISIGSGVTDIYQPLEKKEKLMQSALDILHEYNFPIMICTKSSLILRDIDKWEMLSKKNGFCLAVSLTFTNDNERQIFEPGASSIEERLKTIKTFKERGMYVGVLGLPLLPYITDTFENINELFTRLKELSVDFIVPGGLTLRPGRQKELFFNTIKEQYPQLLNDYSKIFSENRASGNTTYAYRKILFKKFSDIFKELALPFYTPHSIYKNKMPIYDEIFILLNHMQLLYKNQKIDTARLKKSLASYTAWLLAEKKFFNRKRSLSQSNLEDKLREMIVSGEINQFLKNAKLSDFIYKIIIEQKVFDYVNLKLI